MAENETVKIKNIKIKVNGKETKAPEGINLIDAAELAGVHIPNLCYLKGLKGIGACRLCLVEVEGMKAPLTACTTKAKDGMSIITGSEKIDEVRKFVIDLILSMHPLDCMTCTKAGVCNLQQYAYDMGIKESSFTRKKNGYPTDEANPFIKRDPEYCVLCGRCVRVCKSQGTNVLEFMGRGVGSKVMTADDKPLQESGCTFCGSCVDVCPVNSLLEADRWRKGREWDYEAVKSTCMLCGNGCEINVSTKDGRVMKVNAAAVEGSAGRYICAYGRFGFDCIEAGFRATAPMKRVGGELKETTWEDAIQTVAEKLKAAGKDAGIITTAGMLNEDALTLKKMAVAANIINVDSTASLYSNAATLGSGGADLESADLFVVIDLYPDQHKRVLPGIDALIRKRIGAGAKLIVINGSGSSLSEAATVNMTGDEAGSLKSLVKAVIEKGLNGNKELAHAVSGAAQSEEAGQAAALFAGAENPVVLTSPAMYNAASNLGLLKGSVVSVPLESNAKGFAAMGIPAGGKSYSEMLSGGMKVLYVVGEVPLNTRPETDFLVVQGSHMTELAKQADVVLPAAAYLESDGTIMDYLGRTRDICKAVEPAGEAKPHRTIFAQVAKAMGAEIKEAIASETAEKLAATLKPASQFRPFERESGFNVAPQEMMESLNASIINGSRLLWLKEAKVQA
ncbi:MAG: molybdopterin-dependent oxidoreductase [Nitrospiraceae bacterium]|nr:molybdopterin-dependent oxidoreductase [Nitrospiraceae bacterium]